MPVSTHFEPDSARFEPDSAHIEPDSVHFEPDSAHFEPDSAHFFISLKFGKCFPNCRNFVFVSFPIAHGTLLDDEAL